MIARLYFNNNSFLEINIPKAVPRYYIAVLNHDFNFAYCDLGFFKPSEKIGFDLQGKAEDIIKGEYLMYQEQAREA